MAAEQNVQEATSVLLPLVSPIGLAIVIIVCATLLAIVFGLMFMGYRASVGKEGVFMNPADRKAKKLAPHANCGKRLSGMDALRRTMEFTDRREELKKSILEKQMDFYEEKEEEAKTLMQQVFGEILKEKFDIDDLPTDKNYNDFSKTLYITFGNLKKIVRKWFKNNHYADLEPADQIAYISSKKGVIINKVTEELTFNWFPEGIQRKDFGKADRELQPDFERIIETVFARAFLIASDSHKKISLLEANYCQFVKDTYGEDAVVLLGKDDEDLL